MITVGLFNFSLSILFGDAEQVSCIFWTMLLDVHSNSTVAAVKYLSSIVANVEGVTQQKGAQLGISDGLPLLEQNIRKGKFRLRFKRRNGRVRLMVWLRFLYFCFISFLGFPTSFLLIWWKLYAVRGGSC